MSFKTGFCKFGNVAFRITADDFIAQRFDQEFGGKGKPEDIRANFFIAREDLHNKADIIQRFEHEASPLNRCIHYKNRVAEFFVSLDNPINVLIVATDRVEAKLGRMLPRQIQRLLTYKYMTVEEIVYGRILYYAVLWWLFIIYVREGKLFLHASCVRVNGKVYAFCAQGGVGKTTLCGWAFRFKNADFISDDLLPVSEAGEAIPSEIFVHIYPYNHMEDFLWDNTWSLRRLHWECRKRLLGPKRVVARKSPQTVYSRILQTKQPLDAIIWLERTDSNPRLERGNPKEFVPNHLSVLQHELRDAFRFFAENNENAALAAWLPEGFNARAEKNLNNVTNRTTLYRFEISHEIGIERNAEFLFSNL